MIYLINNGFSPQHSTSSLLLECFYDWCTADNDGIFTDVIYIDFNKAFNIIPQTSL